MNPRDPENSDTLRTWYDIKIKGNAGHGAEDEQHESISSIQWDQNRCSLSIKWSTGASWKKHSACVRVGLKYY